MRVTRSILASAALLAASCSTGPGPDDAGRAPTYDDQPLVRSVYEPLWLENYQNASPGEPRLEKLDEGQAVRFLDETSRKWANHNGCGTCHTNIPYMMVRPLTAPSKAGDETMALVRTKMAEFYRKNANDPLKAFYAAPAASSLAVNDALTTGRLSAETRELFDAAWALQHEDGNWQYPLDHMLPFLERQRKYVAYLVSVGVGYLPEDYKKEAVPARGIARLMRFIRSNLPDDDHDKAILLWSSARNPDILRPAERKAYQRALWKLQRPDGGWSLHSLGHWPRHDGAFDDPLASDAYATAIVTLGLCSSGFDAADRRIAKSLALIRASQRVSGRWYMRSTYSEQFKGYISNMATAYSMLALKTCRGGEPV